MINAVSRGIKAEHFMITADVPCGIKQSIL